MVSNKTLEFGPTETMVEVPKGEHAELEFSKDGKDIWEYKEDGDYGMKYFIPLILFKHPSYESISSSGLEIVWASKAQAAEALYNIVLDAENDLHKEIFGRKWKLIRNLTGSYNLKQL